MVAGKTDGSASLAAAVDRVSTSTTSTGARLADPHGWEAILTRPANMATRQGAIALGVSAAVSAATAIENRIARNATTAFVTLKGAVCAATVTQGPLIC